MPPTQTIFLPTIPPCCHDTVVNAIEEAQNMGLSMLEEFALVNTVTHGNFRERTRVMEVHEAGCQELQKYA